MTVAEGRGRGRVTLVIHRPVIDGDPRTESRRVIVIPRTLVQDVFWNWTFIRVKLVQEKGYVLDSEWFSELSSDEVAARAVHSSIVDEDGDVVWQYVQVDEAQNAWTWRRTPDVKTKP